MDTTTISLSMSEKMKRLFTSPSYQTIYMTNYEMTGTPIRLVNCQNNQTILPLVDKKHQQNGSDPALANRRTVDMVKLAIPRIR
jgi:hypothetical protein